MDLDMKINIETITTYRDGGTISIKGFMQGFREKEICIDRRIGVGNDSVWVGYPDKKDSIRITDKDFLQALKKEVVDYTESVNKYKDIILELL